MTCFHIPTLPTVPATGPNCVTYYYTYSYPYYPYPYPYPSQYPDVVVHTQTQTPHKCPVCEGRGKVEKGFYDNDELTCRSCLGLGVIWHY